MTETIEVATDHGPVAARLYETSEHFAITASVGVSRDYGRYTVTHMPTGRRTVVVSRIGRAREFLRVAEASGVDWSFTRVEDAPVGTGAYQAMLLAVYQAMDMEAPDAAH